MSWFCCSTAGRRAARYRDHRLLQGDEGKQQHAGRYLRPPARQRSVEIDVGLDQPLDEYTEKSTDHGTLPARQERAADHHRRDRVELDADGRKRIAGGGEEREN